MQKKTKTKHNLQKLGIVRQANIAGQLRFEGGTPTSQGTYIRVKIFFGKKTQFTETRNSATNKYCVLRAGPPTSQPRLRECPMLLLRSV